MTAELKITTRCPVCKAKYRVPAAAAGRKAHCGKCKASFKVIEHNPHPTEDDILRWLNEGMDEYDFPRRPRVIDAGGSSMAPSPVPSPALSTAEPRISSDAEVSSPALEAN